MPTHYVMRFHISHAPLYAGCQQQLEEVSFALAKELQVQLESKCCSSRPQGQCVFSQKPDDMAVTPPLVSLIHLNRVGKPKSKFLCKRRDVLLYWFRFWSSTLQAQQWRRGQSLLGHSCACATNARAPSPRQICQDCRWTNLSRGGSALEPC